nr:MAG TPA: hypothetical protein [Caudoviricetes sp.]
MNKRLRLKKMKQKLQKMMFDEIWNGSNQEKRKILKMTDTQMIVSLRKKVLGY